MDFSSSGLEEDGPLRDYQRDHDAKLEEKVRQGDEKRERMIEEARVAIDEFYQKRAQAKEKLHAKNREVEKKFLAERDFALENSNSDNASTIWENAANLVDFKQAPVGRDTSRMRKILIDLKQKRQ